MFLIVRKDGSYELKELDPNNVDPKDLKDVERIYRIDREYVPVVRLVPKKGGEEGSVKEQPKKRTKRRNGK